MDTPTWKPPTGGKTLITLILDRSGSMSGKETDVIGGVNAFIAEQKTSGVPVYLSMTRFDTGRIERFRPMTEIQNVEPLTAGEYQPAGGTPLLDAIGQTLNKMDADWLSLKPERGIVVVVTDGQENASTEFSKERIRQMITARENSKVWTFIYLGANVDAFAEAGAMGFKFSNTAGYTPTSAGTSHAFSTASNSVYNITVGNTRDANLGKNLGESAQEDQVPGTKWEQPKPTTGGTATGTSTDNSWKPPS